MAGPKYHGFNTLQLHAGQRPDREQRARATPIYQSTSFVFDDADQASSLFDAARSGHVYSRISNPTVGVVEERVAALEGGVAAVATASGMAAIHLVLSTLTGAGAHVVASRSLYGGTHNLLSYTLPRFGVSTTFVDPRDPQAFEDAIQDNTKLIFAETISNPAMEILDIPRISAIAESAGVPLVLDATLSTPHLQKPLQQGAHVVVHSLTKFLGGHGTTLGGIVVDGGHFDWEASGRFPQLTEPYAGFHGMDFCEEFGPIALAVRMRKEGLRDFGACLPALSAFQLLQGIETLSLRMDKHVDNTESLIDFLSEHEAVATVHHPKLESHPDHHLAQKLLPKGCGAVFSFELCGGRAAGEAFIDALQIFSHLANVGDARSLVIHPASTTHSRMSDEDLIQVGIGPGLIRLSVGLEDTQDLIGDLATALKSASKAAQRAGV